ncbi:MAG: hypothetical protein AAB592_05925 [Patescibacteria group bacterium]
MTKNNNNNAGFGALAVIMMITPIILIVIGGSLLATRTGTQRFINHYESLQTSYDTYQCMETALFSLKNNRAYTGSVVSFSDTVCTITLAEEGTSQRTIKITTTAKNKYTHTMYADITVTENNLALTDIRE